MSLDAMLEIIVKMLDGGCGAIAVVAAVIRRGTAYKIIADCIEIIHSYANYSWHLWNMVVLTTPIKRGNLHFDEMKIINMNGK